MVNVFQIQWKFKSEKKITHSYIQNCYVQLRHVRYIISVGIFSNTLEMLPFVQLWEKRERERVGEVGAKKNEHFQIDEVFLIGIMWKLCAWLLALPRFCHLPFTLYNNRNEAFFFSLLQWMKNVLYVHTSTESTLSFCICENG